MRRIYAAVSQSYMRLFQSHMRPTSSRICECFQSYLRLNASRICDRFRDNFQSFFSRDAGLMRICDRFFIFKTHICDHSNFPMFLETLALTHSLKKKSSFHNILQLSGRSTECWDICDREQSLHFVLCRVFEPVLTRRRRMWRGGPPSRPRPGTPSTWLPTTTPSARLTTFPIG